jgi:hypothetical protein
MTRNVYLLVETSFGIVTFGQALQHRDIITKAKTRPRL